MTVETILYMLVRVFVSGELSDNPVDLLPHHRGSLVKIHSTSRVHNLTKYPLMDYFI
jgi:hypothetical protein